MQDITYLESPIKYFALRKSRQIKHENVPLIDNV